MLQSVAALDFCSVKYLYSCGTTCITSKKSNPPTHTQIYRLGLWHHFILVQPTFIKQLLCARYRARGWVCTDQSSFWVLKSSQYFQSFLVSQCCVFLLKRSLPRSPPHELKCFKDPSLIMFYLCPQETRGPSGPMPGRVKAPKHKIMARGPLRWVMKRRWLLCKWPIFPGGRNKECRSVFCTPSVGHNGRECPSKALSKGLAHECHLEEQWIPTKTVYQEPTVRQSLSVFTSCFIFPYLAMCVCFTLSTRL